MDPNAVSMRTPRPPSRSTAEATVVITYEDGTWATNSLEVEEHTQSGATAPEITHVCDE